MNGEKILVVGNFPKVTQRTVNAQRIDDAFKAVKDDETVLPYGCGRSYGDSPVNAGGAVVRMANHNQFIEFDEMSGIVKAQAGVTLNDILPVAVSKGWFLQVSPGTKYVTLGGAIANDVHGKNHHSRGTFCQSVIDFTLRRSDGERLVCSPTHNIDFFAATAGGLGLTGVIETVTLQLRPIESPAICTNTVSFANLDEGLDLLSQSESESEYTVAWVDCLAQGDALGRGIFMSGSHAPLNDRSILIDSPLRSWSIPFTFPAFSLNAWSVKAFNELYYRKGCFQAGEKLVHYEPYFYPLDGISKWNRIYGSKGFFQYQCVVPYENGSDTIRSLLQTISSSGEASFLAVLKTFGESTGNQATQGLLSFPMPGITLALDFPNRGHKTLVLLNALDKIVMEARGRVYPAKDARMSAEAFQCYFPNWKTFVKYKDPKISSSFWRRVTQGAA